MRNGKGYRLSNGVVRLSKKGGTTIKEGVMHSSSLIIIYTISWINNENYSDHITAY